MQISHSFDALNRLTNTVDRAGGITSSDYNEADQLTTYTDPRSIDTGFAYNGFGELLTETSEDRGTITYTYNNRGLAASMTDARGVVSTYEYDNGGRLIRRRFPSAPTERQNFFYDIIRSGGTDINGVGKIGQVVDESGWTSTVYRNNGTPSAQIRNIEGKQYVINYNFDAEGNLKTSTSPSKLLIRNIYNAADQLVYIDQRHNVPDPQTGQYPPFEQVIYDGRYRPFGPLKFLFYGDDLNGLVTHDKSYRAARVWDRDGGVMLRDIRLQYTLRDNKWIINNALDASDNRNFSFNSREHLASADGPWGDLDYTYDSVGNRLSRLLNGSTESYTYPSSKNRLSSVSGGRVFTHDAAGNVTIDQRGADFYVYAYNAANRMQSVTLNGVLQAEYVYNALGQQVIRRVGGQTIHSIHDFDSNRIAEYDFDGATQVSTLLREYIWMDGTPVAVVENGAVYYVRTDHIGRPVFATDGAGTKVWEASYLPFGGVFTSTGANTTLRFPGQWFQSESGLHQNWMRDYDPTTGRYMQADPLGLVDGASVYGYALQNPGKYVDPRGGNTIILGGTYGGVVGGPPGVVIGGIIGGVIGIGGYILYNELTDDPGLGALDDATEVCKSCLECTPYPKGTIGYIGPHHDHPHFPVEGSHYNLFQVNQRPVRRQSFWDQRRLKLRESLAHLVGYIMRRVVCDASAGFRAFCV